MPLRNFGGLTNSDLNDKKDLMTVLANSYDADVIAPGADLGEPSVWCGAIRTDDGRSNCVVYSGFARSSAEVVAATQFAAECARSTIAFARASTPDNRSAFNASAVAASRPINPPIDAVEISEIGLVRHFFTPAFDWDDHLNPYRKDSWPHELVVAGQAFFPHQTWGSEMPGGTGGRRASSESSVSRLMESVLWTDPAIRRALAAGRSLSVKWGAGFFPGWEITKSGVCVAKFAVWDAEDNTFVKVGNVAASAVLALALRTRNLSARREGILSFAPEFPLIAKLPSATLTAALRAALLRGGDDAWRERRAAINYLKRLGLIDLARQVAEQANAPARDVG